MAGAIIVAASAGCTSPYQSDGATLVGGT